MSRFNCSLARSFGSLAACGVLMLSTPALAADRQTPSSPAPAATANSPEALAALDSMSTLLRSLTKFELRVDGHREIVTKAGQKIQLHTVSMYQVKFPDKLAVVTRNLYQNQAVVFDGQKLVILLPNQNLYAEANFKGSVSEMLIAAYNDYGVSFPVQDMFRWGSEESWTGKPKEAIVVGPDLVNGWVTTQYAVRMDNVDFQIWLDQGGKPMPRRLVITDLTDPSNPQFSADFTWNLTPEIDDAAFTVPTAPPDGATPPARIPIEQLTRIQDDADAPVLARRSGQ